MAANCVLLPLHFANQETKNRMGRKRKGEKDEKEREKKKGRRQFPKMLGPPVSMARLALLGAAPLGHMGSPIIAPA